MEKLFLENLRTKERIREIEDAAFDCGCIDLNVIQYAVSENMIQRDFPTMDCFIYEDDLQEIASIFTDC